MKCRSIVSVVLTLSLLPFAALADGMPDKPRGRKVPSDPNVVIQPETSPEPIAIDPVPEGETSGMLGSYDGSDDPNLFRETIDFKSWLAASKLWNSMRESQRNVALDRTIQQVAFGAAALGASYYLLTRSPLAARLLVLIGAVSSIFVSSANADETFAFQAEKEGVSRFYHSYNLAVRAMEMHRQQKAEMMAFHRELYKQMQLEVENSGHSR